METIYYIYHMVNTDLYQKILNYLLLDQILNAKHMNKGMYNLIIIILDLKIIYIPKLI